MLLKDALPRSSGYSHYDSLSGFRAAEYDFFISTCPEELFGLQRLQVRHECQKFGVMCLDLSLQPRGCPSWVFVGKINVGYPFVTIDLYYDT